MSQIIRFVAKDSWNAEVHLPPVPAYKMVPDWWRNGTPFVPSAKDPTGKNLTFEGNYPANNFKKCMPMLDALTAGYIVPLSFDTYIEYEHDFPIPKTKTQRSYFERHNFLTREIQTPYGYHPQVVKFAYGWFPITPKGYSVLVTSPFGYQGLPFLQVPAIIDTDVSTHEFTLPMWVRRDATEILQGTPLALIIPFKRDNWKATYETFDGDYYAHVERTQGATMFNHYKKKVWGRKEFK